MTVIKLKDLLSWRMLRGIAVFSLYFNNNIKNVFNKNLLRGFAMFLSCLNNKNFFNKNFYLTHRNARARLRRVPLAVEIRARSLKRLGNSFRSGRAATDRAERRRARRTERVLLPWPLVGRAGLASLSRPSAYSYTGVPHRRGRTTRERRAPTYDRSSQKSRDSKEMRS